MSAAERGDRDWLMLAARAGDDEWFAATGHCGGCGDDAEKCCGGCKGNCCLVCPERIATGEAEAGMRFT